MKEPIIISKKDSASFVASSMKAQNQRKEVFEFCLKTLSPIHIGCDEVYEPMCFVMDESSEKMTVFDAESFLENLNNNERQEFSNICKEGSISSILKIYKFISRHKPTGHKIQVSPGLIGHYKKTLSLPLNNERMIKNELNRFMIGRTSFSPTTGRPYIPGSAIKGAFRTAYLNHLADSGKTRHARDARELEKLLMEGSFNSDPFRFLKISDFMPLGDISTQVVYAINEKKKTSKFEAKGPYQILEVIPAGSMFTGILNLEFPLISGQIARPLTSERLFSSVGAFFGKERKREEETLRGINAPTSINSSPEGLMLRIGRHSGAESLTVERFRNIKIMKGKGEQPSYGKTATTLWLASPYDKRQPKQVIEPFGWAALVEVTKEQRLEMNKLEVAWRTDFEAAQSSMMTQRLGAGLSEMRIEKAPKISSDEIWNSAVLAWDPGRQQAIATLGAKKAYHSGKDIIPESMQKAVVQKKKVVKANITVNSSYKILKIEPA